MSTVRTPWHVFFAIFLKEMAPPDIQLKFEVILNTEPQRGDILLLRRGDAGHRDEEARTFRGLWPLLPAHSLVEYKSLSWPLRRGDLARLQGYGAQYFVTQLEDGPLELAELALVLIIPTRTPTLEAEIGRMGWTMTSLGGGYARIDGSGYAYYLAIIEEVSKAEQDELLGLFSRRRKWTQSQAAWLWTHHAGSLEDVNVQNVEGYDQIITEMMASMPLEKRLEGLAPEQRLAGLAPEQRLAGLAPEQRLAGLAPEQRLAGLAPEQQILALSDEVLRTLPDEYLRSLPAGVIAAIQARIGRPAND